jgi:hypothetical protein
MLESVDLRSEPPKHKSFTVSDTQLLATVKPGEQATSWEKVETGVRDAAALTMTFTRSLQRASGRSGHSNERRERMPSQAARPSMLSSSGSRLTRASGSSSWPTARATISARRRAASGRT